MWNLIPLPWRIAASLTVLIAASGAVYGAYAYVRHQGYVDAQVHFETVEKPAVIKATQATDAEAFELAAGSAQKAAQLAKFKAIETVTQQFYEQQAVADAESQAAADALKQEIADYEKQLRESGHSCLATQSDVDFISGVRKKP